MSVLNECWDGDLHDGASEGGNKLVELSTKRPQQDDNGVFPGIRFYFAGTNNTSNDGCVIYLASIQKSDETWRQEVSDKPEFTATLTSQGTLEGRKFSFHALGMSGENPRLSYPHLRDVSFDLQTEFAVWRTHGNRKEKVFKRLRSPNKHPRTAKGQFVKWDVGTGAKEAYMFASMVGVSDAANGDDKHHFILLEAGQVFTRVAHVIDSPVAKPARQSRRFGRKLTSQQLTDQEEEEENKQRRADLRQGPAYFLFLGVYEGRKGTPMVMVRRMMAVFNPDGALDKRHYDVDCEIETHALECFVTNMQACMDGDVNGDIAGTPGAEENWGSAHREMCTKYFKDRTKVWAQNQYDVDAADEMAKEQGPAPRRAPKKNKMAGDTVKGSSEEEEEEEDEEGEEEDGGTPGPAKRTRGPAKGQKGGRGGPPGPAKRTRGPAKGTKRGGSQSQSASRGPSEGPGPSIAPGEPDAKRNKVEPLASLSTSTAPRDSDVSEAGGNAATPAKGELFQMMALTSDIIMQHQKEAHSHAETQATQMLNVVKAVTPVGESNQHTSAHVGNGTETMQQAYEAFLIQRRMLEAARPQAALQAAEQPLALGAPRRPDAVPGLNPSPC
jgi:hypothetical protein